MFLLLGLAVFDMALAGWLLAWLSTPGLVRLRRGAGLLPVGCGFLVPGLKLSAGP